jgi:ubiquinone/menaquinone biosynthesis C-methylase UbiE
MASQDHSSTSDYSASNYNQTAAFVYSAEYTTPILSLLKPSIGERIVDFGCGTGELTLQIQEAVGASGLTVGIDYNNDMVRSHEVSCLHLTDIFIRFPKL